MEARGKEIMRIAVTLDENLALPLLR